MWLLIHRFWLRASRPLRPAIPFALLNRMVPAASMVRNLVLTSIIGPGSRYFIFREEILFFPRCESKRFFDFHFIALHPLTFCADTNIENFLRGNATPMIELTRLNGERMVVNSDLIHYAESSPDTVITLITGDKIVVSESTDILIERVIAFRSRLLQHAFPGGPTILDPGQFAAAAAASAAQSATTAISQALPEADQNRSWKRRRREID